MNSETVSSASQIINIAYQEAVEAYIFFATLVILIYASFLHFPDEVEYIWKEKFTLPTYLYFFSKYPTFFYLSLLLVRNLTNLSLDSPRLCNNLSILLAVTIIFPLIGTQGLITIRTYALCRYSLSLTTVLLITFLTALVPEIYSVFAIPTCGPTHGSSVVILDLIHAIAIILLDTLAFTVVIRQTWGLWKLKQRLGLQNSQELTELVLQQGILRFGFVLVSTTTVLLLSIIPTRSPLAVGDLRRRNQQHSVLNQSDLQLPTISFRENPVESI